MYGHQEAVPGGWPDTGIHKGHTPSYNNMSKCRFSMIRISIFTSKQYITTWIIIMNMTSKNR